MKRSGEKRDRIDALAGRLEESIRELEAEQFERERDFQKLYADSAELLGLSRRGPAYIRERARRLNDLLSRLHRNTGYVPDRFQLLFRQIDKIKDPLISDFFSPALQSRIDRLAATSAGTGRSRPRAPLMYRLGGFSFLLRSPVRQVLREVRPGRSMKFPQGPVDFFPHPDERDFAALLTDEPLDLLVVENPGGFLGLWCQTTLPVSLEQARRMAHNQDRSRAIHGRISGRTKYAGNYVYLISTE